MIKFLTPLLLLNSTYSKEFIMGVTSDPHSKKSKIYKEGIGFVTQAYKNIGHDLKLKLYSANATYKMATRGMIDSEFLRVKNLEKKYPYLVRVPYKVLDFKIYVYSIHNNPNEINKDNYTSFKIGYHKDYYIVKKHLNTKSLTSSNSFAQLITGLIKNKYDYVLLSNFHLVDLMNLQEKHESRIIKKSDAPLLEDELFHYVNIKHKNLVKKLEESFKSIKISEENYPLIYLNRE